MSRLERPPAGDVALAARHALAHAMPFALWTLDGEAMDHVIARFKATEAREDDAAPSARMVALACDTVRVIDVNPPAVALFRGDDLTSLLKPMAYLFSAAPETAGHVLAAALAGRREHVEDMTIRCFDGRTLDVLLHVTFPAPAEPTRAILVLMIDITGRLRGDALMASITHEIRQPLSAIVTNADASLRWLDRPTPSLEKVRLLMGRIAANAHRASDILVRGHLPGGRRGQDDGALDFNAVVAETCDFVRHDAEDRRIDLEVTLPEHPPRIRGDRVQLQQVIFNLLSNALQAIDQGDGRRRQVSVRLWIADGARLSVEDTGPGIPPHDLDRIFTRAYTTKPDGMGLGLAICRSVVEAHDGAINASNLPGGGARFEVVLPC